MEVKCSECKKKYMVGIINPYYFSRYKKSFWICYQCKDKVHERYRKLDE